MNRLHQGQEGHVKAQHAVFRVVDDPGELLGMQAGVQGVQHAACPADAEIQFQVAIAVPRQRRHPVALSQLARVQRVGHLSRPGGRVFPGVTVDVALDPAGDDLPIGMVALGVHDQR